MEIIRIFEIGWGIYKNKENEIFMQNETDEKIMNIETGEIFRIFERNENDVVVSIVSDIY